MLDGFLCQRKGVIDWSRARGVADDPDFLCSAAFRYGRSVGGFDSGGRARVDAMGARHGFDAAEVVHRAHGRPSITTVREYLPNGDHLAENREIERDEIVDLDGIVPLPGARELLRALPRGRWTIVTSCTRRLAETRLKTSGLPQPEVFVTSSDITNGKPAPDPYLKGAELLGFSARDCVVVEDAPAGVRSGKAAGARVIALRTTMAERELCEAGADWVVRDCAAIALIALRCTTGSFR